MVKKIKLSETFDPEMDYSIWYHVTQNGYLEESKILKKLLMKKYKAYSELYTKFKALKIQTMRVNDLTQFSVPSNISDL